MTCKSSFITFLPTVDKNSLDFEWFPCLSLLILACNCLYPVYVFCLDHLWFIILQWVCRLSFLVLLLLLQMEGPRGCGIFFVLDLLPWRSCEGHFLRFWNSLFPWVIPVTSLMLFSFVNVLPFYFDTCRILKWISLIKNWNTILLLLPSYSERPFPPRCCLLSVSFHWFCSFSVICSFVCL